MGLTICLAAFWARADPSPSPTPGPSASASPSPSGTPKPSMGYVRFWNMLPGDKPTDQFQLLNGETTPMTTAQPGNFYAGYLPVPPATYNFVVRRASDPANVLKRLPVLMRGDTYITILVSDKDGQPNAELIDDTPNPKLPNGPCHLVIRHFFPKATITVTPGSLPATGPLTYGSVMTIDNLPTGTLPLALQATGLGAGSKSWTTEADFNVARHATLLLVPDAYGRFRPRLAADGLKSNGSNEPDRKP